MPKTAHAARTQNITEIPRIPEVKHFGHSILEEDMPDQGEPDCDDAFHKQVAQVQRDCFRSLLASAQVVALVVYRGVVAMGLTRLQ